MTLEDEERDRGLDLSRLDDATADEAAAFGDFYRQVYGSAHPGLDFFISEGRPDLTKRYRSFAQAVTTGEGISGFPWCLYYPEIGFEAYIPRQVHMLQTYGYSRSQVLELYGVMFLVAGPHGAEVVARALEGYDWRSSSGGPTFPPGWRHDPAQLRSGIDSSTAQVLPGEVELIIAWYQRVLGEVPAYVAFLARHRPDVLKAYRNRFETLLHELPNQVIPAMLLHHAVIHARAGAIRENVLLARGLGMTRAEALEIVVLTGLYGVPEPITAVAQSAGDLFDTWR